ncbi:transcriptional regulator family: HMG [Paecilomyces variotii]|nr:transcriptional regulator family: HMG [Paecilomyces variotii]
MASTVSAAVIKSAAESMDQVTDLLWQDALRHLTATNNEVLLPINVTDLIGQSNVNKIKARLCALIQAPVVAFVDESINALRIMRTPAFAGSATSAACHVLTPALDGPGHEEARFNVTKESDKIETSCKGVKVPRPPNAFILYRQHHHPIVKAAHPEFHNNDISVVLGKQWKGESQHVKAHFQALAEQIKRKHSEAYPNYQYTPRKQNDKKRRTVTSREPRYGKRGIISMTQVSPIEQTTTVPVEQSFTTDTPAQIMSDKAVGDCVTYAESQLSDLFLDETINYENVEFDEQEFESMIHRAESAQDKAALFEEVTFVPAGAIGPDDWTDFIM